MVYMCIQIIIINKLHQLEVVLRQAVVTFSFSNLRKAILLLGHLFLCIMCLAVLASLLAISSYIWLFALPILGTFCGIEAVLRLSLLLYLQTLASSFLPTSLVRVLY